MKVKFDIDTLEDIARHNGLKVHHYKHEETDEHPTLLIFRNTETDEFTYVWYSIEESGQDLFIPELHDPLYEIERVIYDCSVQVLSNDDDDVSVGWWYDEPLKG